MVEMIYNIFALLPRHHDNLSKSSLVSESYFNSIVRDDSVSRRLVATTNAQLNSRHRVPKTLY